MGQGFWKNGCTTPPFFEATLGSVKSSIPHGDWKFPFFSIFIFPKFRIHLDLHIYHRDFCFIKELRSLKNSQELLVLWKFFVPFFSAGCI
jgi:hypothetical protein